MNIGHCKKCGGYTFMPSQDDHICTCALKRMSPGEALGFIKLAEATESVTDELNRVIAENNGSARDALNVTLAQLKAERSRADAFEAENRHLAQIISELHDAAALAFAHMNDEGDDWSAAFAFRDAMDKANQINIKRGEK